MENNEHRAPEQRLKAKQAQTGGRHLADQLADFMNHNGYQDTDAFVNQIVHRTHRTLQQEIFGLFVALCEEWAKQDGPGQYDLRNEATIAGAKKVTDVLKNHPLPFI
jgi:hypothetical protein